MLICLSSDVTWYKIPLNLSLTVSSLSIHVVDDQLTDVESPVSNDGEPASLGSGVVSEISAVCDISSDEDFAIN